MAYRIGTGFDIHRLVEGRPLILGGIEIPWHKGLLGHSDGDALIHAVCDALLGAQGKDDIGVLYPDNAAATKDIDSMRMLDEIVRATVQEYEIINIDTNCICEKPKLGPHREPMRAAIAKACGIPTSAVSVKFRTHEGLGDIGHGDAIATQAVVLLQKRPRS